jgi:hypothetical protein
METNLKLNDVLNNLLAISSKTRTIDAKEYAYQRAFQILNSYEMVFLLCINQLMIQKIWRTS